MSLGFARDSILNLQQLAHDDDEPTAAPGIGGGGDGDDFDVGMCLEDDVGEVAPKSTMVPFPAASPSSERSKGAVAFSQEAEGAPMAVPSGAGVVQQAAAAAEEEPPKTVIKQYAGFQTDYAGYDDYYNDPYAVGYGGGYAVQAPAGKKKNVFCCLFAPWTAGKEFDDGDSSGMGEGEAEEKRMEQATQPSVETGAEVVPKEVTGRVGHEEEKKVEDEGAPFSGAKKQPAEVMAAAEEEKTEETAGAAAAPAEPEKGEEKPEVLPKKGILKKCKISMHKSPSILKADASKRDDASASSADHRRHMFPSYSCEAATNEGGPAKKSTRLGFAPMARVVTVASRKDMSFVSKSQIWWQRTDYDDFKKTGRIIAKAMLEGGSEIWLTSNDAWGKKRSSVQRASSDGNGGGGGNNEDERDTEYEKALHKYSKGLQQEAGESAAQETYGNKWWCKFGHSRRGLEHIASMEEGRQRQRNVNTATRAVIDEQRKQRMMRNKDPRRLANIAHQYTSWARDLALAAGAADAEAVRVGFKTDAKCRTHYLVKGADALPNAVATAAQGFTDSRKYSFISGHIAAELLDANTASSMKTKREDAKQKQQSAASAAAAAAAKVAPIRDEGASTPPLTDEMEEAIHDPEGGGGASKENMAKKAAGFAANEDEKVDMSAVLSGMGSVTVQG